MDADCSISADSLFEAAIDRYLGLRNRLPMAPRSSPSSVQAWQPTPRLRRRRALVLSENTANSYAEYAISLKLFFAGMRLREIRVGNLLGYQATRLTGMDMFVRHRRPQDAKARVMPDGTVLPAKGKTPCPVKPKKVNQELGLLQMLLRHAGAWTQELDEQYVLLEEMDDDVPRALTPTEQEHWLHTAAADPETAVVYWYSLVAFETLNSTDEMRAYRVGDWNLAQRTAIVRRGKVRSRERTIHIADPDALWAMERLLERAAQCGARDYRHCIFPWRQGRAKEWDVLRPMSSSGLKTPWNLVRERSGLKWFRLYDTRHTAITRCAEAGMPIEMIKDKAGHITDKMSRHYTHVSEAARQRWAEYAYQAMQWQRQMPPAMPRMAPQRDYAFTPKHVPMRANVGMGA